MKTIIDNFILNYPDEMTIEEAQEYIPIAKQIWEDDGKSFKSLGGVVLTLNGDDVYVNPQPIIRRVRRITGYLSEVSNINQAKTAEIANRVETSGEQKYAYDNDRKNWLREV